MRRMMLLSAAIALIALQAQAQAQAHAQTPTQTPSPSSPSATAPAAAAPRTASSRPAYRQTMEQRFQAANTTKDGHLTRDQASAAKWSYVTRHFDAIDKSHQGFVTPQDIRGYARDQRAARAAATAPKSNG